MTFKGYVSVMPTLIQADPLDVIKLDGTILFQKK